jgi:phosphoserine phosphatase
VLHVQAQTVAVGDGEKDGVRACENVGVAIRASPDETRKRHVNIISNKKKFIPSLNWTHEPR